MHYRATMSFECPFAFQPLTDAQFAEIDAHVMAGAYAAQNKLGRLCEERVYENDVPLNNAPRRQRLA